MKDAWEDPAFASGWDRDTERANPSRAVQIATVTAIVARLHRPGATILDLGAGSGRVDEALLKACPAARIVAVDSSAAMMDLARRRLAGFAGRVSFVQGAFERIEEVALPQAQIALSVQALHHVDDAVKERVMGRVHRLLEPAGVFLLVDRIELGPAELRPVHAALWEDLDRAAARPSGLPASSFFDRLADKQDYPSGIEAHLAMLRAAGFRAGCIHLQLNRAIFAAVKPEGLGAPDGST